MLFRGNAWERRSHTFLSLFWRENAFPQFLAEEEAGMWFFRLLPDFRPRPLMSNHIPEESVPTLLEMEKHPCIRWYENFLLSAAQTIYLECAEFLRRVWKRVWSIRLFSKPAPCRRAGAKGPRRFFANNSESTNNFASPFSVPLCHSFERIMWKN